MIDLNMIGVIPFCGKVDEWPIWCEKFLSKAKRFGFKELLLVGQLGHKLLQFKNPAINNGRCNGIPSCGGMFS
jgi:hypothetical protein